MSGRVVGSVSDKTTSTLVPILSQCPLSLQYDGRDPSSTNISPQTSLPLRMMNLRPLNLFLKQLTTQQKPGLEFMKPEQKSRQIVFFDYSTRPIDLESKGTYRHTYFVRSLVCELISQKDHERFSQCQIRRTRYKDGTLDGPQTPRVPLPSSMVSTLGVGDSDTRLLVIYLMRNRPYSSLISLSGLRRSTYTITRVRSLSVRLTVKYV